MALISPLGRRGALSLAGAAAVTRAARADNPPEVKIAMLMPLSGPWARSGLLEQMGARMAVDDVNTAGGIKSLGGAKLTMVEFDAGDSSEKAKDAAQRMLAQEPDLAGGFDGWLSSFVLAITEVTERAELPWMTQGYSDLITSRGFKYVFQSSPTGDVQAEATLPIIVDLAEKATGKRPTRAAIVGDNSAAAVSFLKPIRDHVLKNLGLTLVVDEIYTPPLADATSIVQKLRSGKPDFVLMQSTNVGDDKLLVEKFAEFGLTAKKMPLVGNGGHWCVPELMKLTAPENLEGLIVELANWPGKSAADVERRFIERTKEPWFGHDSIFGYAHARILAEAIDRAGSADRHKVNAELHSMDITTGPALLFPDGRLAYDEKGRRKGAEICIVQFQNGKPVPVYPESIAVSHAVWPKTA
jgi:branched-chain amino acid transport system substrate-binding protein